MLVGCSWLCIPAGAADGGLSSVSAPQLASKLRELLPIAARERPDLIPAFQNILRNLWVRYSPGFGSVRWFHADSPPEGTFYSFTGPQAKIVETLWAAWENGTPEVRQEYLLDAAGCQSARIAYLFRQHGASGKKPGKEDRTSEYHPAWGKLIVPGTQKGTYRLAEPV